MLTQRKPALNLFTQATVRGRRGEENSSFLLEALQSPNGDFAARLDVLVSTLCDSAADSVRWVCVALEGRVTKLKMLGLEVRAGQLAMILAIALFGRCAVALEG